jgi:hypothetical protein
MENKTKSVAEIEKALKGNIPYKWKIQSFAKNDTLGICVAYIDARDVMDRLDSAVGIENWQDSYYRDSSGNLVCKLGIRINGEWIYKEDTGVSGDFEKEKSEYSDAFKRSAVKWGIGRFLYDLDMRLVRVANKKPVDEKGVVIKDLTKYFNLLDKNNGESN